MAPMSKDQAQQYAQWGTWMAQAQEGDQKAYAKLLQEITPLLRRFVSKKLFNQDLVEDTAQEILLAVHKSRHTYRPEQPFETWMFAIARYKIIDVIRSQTRKAEKEAGSINDPDSSFFETIAATETNTEMQDVRQDLEKALTALPDKQRKIVTLLKVQGLSVAEVAQQMSMSTSAVKVSAHRAYKQMKSVLES